MDILYTLVGGAALIGLLFLAALGAFTLFHWFRPQRAPADTSNRINKIRLWWFVLTREEKFVGAFPWLKRDEWDNVNPHE